MNYSGVPTSIPAGVGGGGLATGAAFGSIWLVLLSITFFMLILVLARLMPCREV